MFGGGERIIANSSSALRRDGERFCTGGRALMGGCVEIVGGQVALFWRSTETEWMDSLLVVNSSKRMPVVHLSGQSLGYNSF